jgi:uncharacterized protein (DUF2267 family)
MSAKGLESFDHTVQVTYGWLKELSEANGWRDRQRSYHLLRATLHALRDWLPVNEAVELSAQLPMLVRGIYFEGWRPAATPVKPRDMGAFLGRIDEAFETDPLEGTEEAVSTVFRLLQRHVSEGEIQDVRRSLPADLRGLWQ